MSNFVRLSLILLSPFFATASTINLDQLPWIIDPSKAAHLLKSILPENPIILEAGVHNGTDTRNFKTTWPNSTIYGFEPLPDFFALAKNATQNLTGITLYQCALFDHIGEIVFNRSHTNSGSSSILEDNHLVLPCEHRDYLDEAFTVNCTTINELVREEHLKEIDYIWLDTEGSELSILKASTDILSNVKAITLEVNFVEFRKNMTLFPDLYQFLHEAGFSLVYIWGNRFQADALFVNNIILPDLCKLN